MSSMITSTNLKLEKPLLDDRIFEQFTLPNGILVTTVSDTRSEKSSCSLAVRVGASSDSLPGLAHITEHAVFLGSQKYPVENEYKKFLNKNGGGSNGGTSMEQTVYKFYVNAPEFDGALDIFSQFFKSPLFETQAITREINAVDAEDAKNRILENRRFLQVLKHQILPNSDYSKFSTGNLRTLAFNELTTYGEGLSQKIRDFHQKYYRPREMAVSLVGPQTSEQLKQLAHNHFADISSFDLTSSEVLNSLDTLQTIPKEEQSSVFKNSRHQVIRIKPIRDLRDLSIIWQFPYSKFKYKENPSHLLSFLLNYKGEGSLFAYLQDQRYATSLSANIRTHFPEFTLFEVSLSLTKEGLNDYEKIVSAVYDYLELISTHLNKDGTFLKEGDDDQLTRLWEEMKAIRKINFLFEEKASPYETSPELAESMLEYPLHEIMSAGRLLNDFPRKDFQIYLEKMLNDPSYVILRSKDFDHLPNDEIYKIDEFMKKFEELQNKDELEKWKREGNYFERFRVWMDTWQKNEQHQKETEKSSFIEYEPYYGVPYEVNSFNLSELRSRARVTHEKTFQLPAINPFISYEMLEYDKILAERKQVCSETDVNHQPNSENIQEKEMDWNVNSAKLGIHQNGETQVKPLQSSPPKLLARFHKDTSTVEKFDVLQETDPSSSMIRNALWFSKDEIYETPKSTVFFLFKTPASDEVHPVSSLITSIFDQMMIRKYYPSSVAGLSHGFSLGQQGLGLRYVGFSNKLAKLAEVVTDDVLNLQTIWEKVDPQLFQDIKEKQFRALQSWFKDRPDSQANTILSYLVFQNSLLPMDKIDLLNQTDLPFLQERMRSIVKSIHNHIAYVHGDLNPSDAYEFYESVVKKVYEKQQHVSSQGGGNSPKDSYVEEQEKIRQLPSTIHHRVILPPFNEEDPNNAYILYFQTEKRSPQVLAKLLVLRKLLAEPAFNILRTKKQLGYIVSLSSADFGRGLRSVGGIELKILSKRFSPIAMEKEVESFLQDQYQHLLNSVTEVEIKNLKQSIITTIKDPMTSLIEEGYHYYSQIINEFPFDWKDQIIDVLQKEGEEGDNQGIHLKDIQQFYEEYVFSPNNACEEKKKSLAIMIFSQEQILEYNELKSNKLADNSVGNFLQRNCHDFMNLEETKTFRDSLDFY